MNKQIIITILILIISLQFTAAYILNENTEVIGSTAVISQTPRFTNINGTWEKIEDAIKLTYGINTITAEAGQESITFRIGLNYNNTYYTIESIPTSRAPNFNTRNTKTERKLKYDIIANLDGLDTSLIQNITLTEINSNTPSVYNSKSVTSGKLLLTYEDVILDGYNYTIEQGKITITDITINIVNNLMTIDPEITLNETNIQKDTYISEGNPSTNYGTDTQMRVRSNTPSDEISIITWNITGIIPSNATSINAIMNLTELNPTASTTTRVIESTNTTWIETSITYNTFFCAINPNGTINIGGVCNDIITSTVTTGADNAIDQFNISTAITIGKNIVTLVLDNDGVGGDRTRFYTKEIATSANPTLFITWNEVPSAFTIDFEVKPDFFTSEVLTNTSQQTNSTINYGTILGSPTNINKDVGFKFTRSQTLISLTSDTLYFAEQTMCTISDECIEFNYSFQTIILPATGVEELDILDISTCVQFIQHNVINANNSKLYAYGSDPVTSANERIAIIDISNPSSMTLESCFSLGDLGGSPTSISITPSLTTGLDSWLTVGTFLGSGFIRVTNSGSTLTLNNTNSYDMSRSAPTSFLRDDLIFMCEDASDDLSEYNNLAQTITNTLNTGFSNNCVGVSNPIQGTNHLIIYRNEGVAFVSGTNSLRAALTTGNNLGNAGSRDSTDVAGNTILANLVDAIFYDYDSGTNNITKIEPIVQNSCPNCALSGSEFLTNNRAIFYEGNTLTGLATLRTATIGTNITTKVFDITGVVLTAQGSLNYNVPILYLTTTGSGINDIRSYQITTSETAAGNNIKPRITNINPTTITVAPTFPTTIFYDIDNPETTSLAEQVLSAGTCDYTETINSQESFPDTFNFTGKCGKAVIGTRKGITFGNGLDLTLCALNEVLLTDTIIATNSILSFDVYATIDSTAQIELIQSDANTIVTLSFEINNNEMNVTANSARILTNIALNFGGQNIPTRIFVQLPIGTANPNLVSKVAYSTNYFSRNTNIDTTYCDNTVFCYIGDVVTSATMNDFNGLVFKSATGDFAIDNVEVKTTPEYPTYNIGTVLNNLNFQCSYNDIGVKTARIYASDVIYNHNYLNFQDQPITVTVSGQTEILNQTEITAENSSIALLINSIVGIGGFTDDASLSILALILIVGLSIGGFKAGMEAVAILFIDAVALTAFWLLGWIPTSIFVIVALLAAGLIVLVFRKTFIGNIGEI